MTLARRGWHRKYGNYIYDAHDQVVAIFEAPGKTQIEWDTAFKAADDFLRLDRLEGREMREMLTAMQCGEMSVSRGIELIDLWLAGNYSHELLPPVDDGVVGFDEIPILLINQLRDEVEQLKKQLSSQPQQYERNYWPQRELWKRLAPNKR